MEQFPHPQSAEPPKGPEQPRRDGRKATRADLHRRRLDRQLRVLALRFPALRRIIAAIEARRGVLLRAPLALLLLAGGLVGFLPVLGFWMIPLGLLILAIDLPLLRPSVTATMIRARRRWTLWRRQYPRGPRSGRQ